MDTFHESGLRPEILKAVDDLGFTTPTPIQAQTLQLLLNSDQDLIALAQTGTGKTAAFSLPIIDQIDTNQSMVQAIILAPTRELCLQIANDIQKFSKYVPKLNSVAVYGGASIGPQIAALKDKVHIVIGTPGRTLDLVNRKRLDISAVKWLVLDEADEMLSMGFQDDLDAILATSPQEKQTLLFSATMPDEIRRIAGKYMKKVSEVSVGKVNTGNNNIRHISYIVHAKDRYTALKRIADANPNIYGIVFCRTKIETQEVADKLGHDGYNSDALHGDLSQAQRDYVMNRFRKKQLQLLIATDVAARGLDVNELTHVINYNLPDDPEVYIHRSGRTGRAGKTGDSIIIAHSRELSRIKFLEKKINRTIEVGKVPTGKEICKTQLFNLIDKVKGVEVNEEMINPFMAEIFNSIADIPHEELIKRFVSVEFNRFLEYYQDATDINVHDNRGSSKDGAVSFGGKFTKFTINHGYKSNLNPKMLINLIIEHSPDRNIDIGRIDIQKSYSFFEVETKLANDLADAFAKTQYKGLEIKVVSSDKASGGLSYKNTDSGKSGRGYGGGGGGRSGARGEGGGHGRGGSRSGSGDGYNRSGGGDRKRPRR